MLNIIYKVRESKIGRENVTTQYNWITNVETTSMKEMAGEVSERSFYN